MTTSEDTISVVLTPKPAYRVKRGDKLVLDMSLVRVTSDPEHIDDDTKVRFWCEQLATVEDRWGGERIKIIPMTTAVAWVVPAIFLSHKTLHLQRTFPRPR